MTVCSTCKHANYCEIVAGGYSSQVKSCRDYRKGETTNEEWFCTLPTDEKARVLVDNKLFFRMLDYDGFIEWLKEKHTIKE